MRTRKYFRLIALVAIFAATLACAAFGSSGPSTSNFYMASDKDGNNKTTIFSPDQDFYVFFSVSGISAGTVFHAKWYGLDIQDVDATTPFKTIDYDYESGVSTIYFQLTNSNGWPTGHYKVEIYMGDTKVGEQPFSVQ
jgi:hypothetical protein